MMQSLPLEATCQPWKPSRRTEANNYLWSIYAQLVEVAGFDSETWHTHFCGERFGWREVDLPSGHIEYFPKRTTTKDEEGKRNVLKGDAFNEFLMFVEADCAKRGVFIQREREV